MNRIYIMKKLLFTLPVLALLALASCMRDDFGAQCPPKGDGFRLSLHVASPESVVKTRTSIAPEEGEEVVNSLYLLFFDSSENGTGLFLNYYKATGPFAMNQDITVNFTDGGLGASGDQNLNNHTAYNIFLIANLENYLPENATAQSWLDAMIGLNEAQAMDKAELSLAGSTNDGDFQTRSIPSDHLPMSSSFSKAADQEKVSVELLRAVVRFDVYNRARDQWDLVSASVWNAYPETKAWTKSYNDFALPRIKRLFGVESEQGAGNGADGFPVYSDIVGKLYSFENYVSTPDGRDRLTTCLIVGMAKRNGDGTHGTVTYHRANINPADASQYLKRNHVYKLTVNRVMGDGASDEESAYNQNANMIDYVINSWDLDDNGMVLVDETNTLVVPVKSIRLSPDGDTREYSIFTLGPGTLSMNNSQLTNGLSANLVGNRLTIEATPMAPNENERRGTVVITFGRLTGTIDIIQTKNETLFLELNRSNIVEFPAYGQGMMMLGNDIIVSASGSWTATLYNPTITGVNCGFTFDQALCDPAKTELTSAEATDNIINLFTTGDNPANQSRRAFVIVSLDADPDINRSLVLAQRPATGIKLTPGDQTSVRFDALGAATTNTTFKVDPGLNELAATGSKFLPWAVEIVDDPAGMFELTDVNCSTDESENQTFTVSSKVPNRTGVNITARVRIYLVNSPSSEIYLSIVQDKLEWSVPSSFAAISDDGGTTIDIAVTAPAGMTYEVKIQSLSPATLTEHFAYLTESDDAGQTPYSALAARDVSRTFKAGFPKLIYPNQGLQPQATIEVRLVEVNETKTFILRQSPITQNAVKIENVGDSWGRILNSSGSWSGDYNRYYPIYLGNAAYYGPAGVVKTNGAVSAANSTGVNISAATRYVHYSRPTNNVNINRDNAMYSWIYGNDGILVMFVDEDSRNATGSFTPTYLPGKLGLVGTAHDPDAQRYRLNVSGGKIMDYLVKDGPWAPGTSELDDWQTTQYRTSGVTSGVTVASVNSSMPNAVPVLLDSNGGTVLMIDPERNVVYSGDSELFDNYVGNSYDPIISSTQERVLANLLAYVVNAAQYGDNFTDYFWPSARLSMTAPLAQ